MAWPDTYSERIEALQRAIKGLARECGDALPGVCTRLEDDPEAFTEVFMALGLVDDLMDAHAVAQEHRA